MYMSVCGHVGAPRGQKRSSDPLELELQLRGDCELQTWVLGMELVSSKQYTLLSAGPPLHPEVTFKG